MKKFLNFSTILFSYALITVLVISCGGSSGGGGGGTGGTGGTGGNGGGVSVIELADVPTKCLLEESPNSSSLLAIICFEDVVIAEIAKEATEPQQLTLLIDSVANASGTPIKTWNVSNTEQITVSYAKENKVVVDVSKTEKIIISYNKDYKVTLDEPAEGASKLGTISAASAPNTEGPLQLLTMNSLLTDSQDALRSGDLIFSQTSGSAIKVSIAAKLAVKSQDDFISMGRFTAPPLGELKHPLSYVLANDLDLVAPGEEGAKFNDSIIPVVDASFDFDGGGHKISLNSAIDAVAENKPASIIGQLKQSNEFKNFTLDVNQPISGTYAVGTIVGYIQSPYEAQGKIQNINININSNLTVYRDPVAGAGVGSVGGVAGYGCFDINNVVVKTADNASIRSAAKDYGNSFSTNIGGLVGYSSCTAKDFINNSVADVTLGVYAAGDTAPNNSVSIGGLASSMISSPEIRDNIVKFKIYRDEKLPANFAFDKVAGLVTEVTYLNVVTNNLVYVDFSNLGQVKNVGGLFTTFNKNQLDVKISNNMIFIADDFNTGNVTEKFGAAITEMAEDTLFNFIDNFFSTPVTDEQYNTNSKLTSFVHTANSDMTFNNLILDNKTAAVMFKAGTEAANLQGKVGGTNGAPLYTLAEAKTNEVSTIFSADNRTSWEEGSQGYPQLKAPADFSEAKKADWDTINGLIQTGLADRANQ